MASKRSQLTPELKKEIVEMAIETYRKEAEKQRMQNCDRRLHDTKMLMEKYRDFAEYSESTVYDTLQVDENDEFRDIMELMGCGEKMLPVESIRQSVAKIRVLAHHVNRILDFYEYRCKHSKKSEDARRLRVIKALYLDNSRKTLETLAKEENVEVRTICRDLNTALQELSILIFGYFQ